MGEGDKLRPLRQGVEDDPEEDELSPPYRGEAPESGRPSGAQEEWEEDKGRQAVAQSGEGDRGDLPQADLDQDPRRRPEDGDGEGDEDRRSSLVA
jgi:hypothetical protein